MTTAETTEPPVLLTTRDKHVLRLTLNRPHALNCLSGALIRALHEALDDAEQDAGVHVIMLAAAGASFCGGHDFSEFRARESATAHRVALLASNDMMLALAASSKATVACVQGVVVGAGLELVGNCDLAYAADSATFSARGIEIGLWDHTAQVALSRQVGRRHAMEFLLTAAEISAADALRMGLVNRLFEAAALDQEVTRLAQAIADKSPYTVSLGKDSYDHQAAMGRHEAYEYVSDQFYRDVGSADAAEGIAAALEQRTPRWKGR